MVVQHRLDPLLPLAPLLAKRVPQPDTGAQIKDVIGRDPRLRQPLDHQQLPQMASVRPITLRALLWALEPSGLRRLGQMHHCANPTQLLDHEPPTGRRLQRHLQLPTAETLKELPHRSPIRRRHARALKLTRLGIDPFARDLSSMLIKSHYDRQQGPPQAPRLPACADTLRA